uniref:Uncharacterized protein n=1 Tax=Branchiostoma floridae TaxID=7739 RepID=C3YRY7_BRAFL|eukprot:XP_002600880.1 hypothetical protein BRAFLDRAFT_75836 [Branchiostoma floridae]
MSAFVNIHAVANIVNHLTKEELDPNNVSLRRVQLVEEAQSCTQSVNQTPVADSDLTTQAETHQYSNDDASLSPEDPEWGLDDIYASAEPPDLPVASDEDIPGAADHSENTDIRLEDASGQPESQIEEAAAESDEEVMPYGTAKANTIYEDTNTSHISSSGMYAPTEHHCAVDVNQIEMSSCSLSRNSLYEQQSENISTVVSDGSSTREGLGSLYEGCPTNEE